MGKKTNETYPLRREAEARCSGASLAVDAPLRPAEDILHELQVHQIELEMQNEELRRARNALEEARDRYLDLYEFAPVGYLTLSRTSQIEEINLTGATLLGEERRKLLRRRFDNFVGPGDRERWNRLFLSALQQGEGGRECEFAITRKDGTRFHAHLVCLRRQADATAVLRIALTDVSDRRKAEEERRIAAITFESQQGMIVTDTDAVIVRVNRAFTKLTGYSEQEVIGRKPSLLSSGRHDKAFYQCLWTALSEKHYWQGEIWNRRKNGKIYAEWLTISAVAAPDGAITHYVGSFSDITLDKEAQAEIHRLAYYDPLTQLPNRRLLQDRLGQALAAAGRNRQYGALLFLDLDNFKALNDTRGHDAGDLLLVAAAGRLRAAVREGDTVARLGGDEFVVLLEGLSEHAEEAAALSKAIGDKLSEAAARLYTLDGHEILCTTSIGVSLICGHDTAEEVLKHADIALYQAKTGGRNTVRFFDPDMQAVVNARAELEADLRQGLRQGEFVLYYQAQVDGEGRLTGAETLLRWRHRRRGLVSPLAFISLAEDTGLILPLGQWVLETACAQLAAWADRPDTAHLILAVNVSPRQFHHADFVAQVLEVLGASGADPRKLKLELTENLLVDNVEDIIAKMAALKSHGIGFSLDDFGTGYSSLSYLKRLPLEQLKIDRSFVRDVFTDANNASIARTIVTLGQSLGLAVIAEGVETGEQRDFLASLGCFAYQGYFFGRPMALEEFERCRHLHRA